MVACPSPMVVLIFGPMVALLPLAAPMVLLPLLHLAIGQVESLLREVANLHRRRPHEPPVLVLNNQGSYHGQYSTECTLL